jgi:hypothetical protein
MDTSAHLIVLTNLVVVPAVSVVLCKPYLLRLALSLVLGVPVLWARMIYLEEIAADSDFDIVFGLAMIVWATALAICYALVLGVVGLVQAVWRACKRRGRIS